MIEAGKWLGERSQDLIQGLVDHAPKATGYYSDALDVYATLWYH
jgi:hypothetical protein